MRKSQDTDRHARKRPKGNQKNQGQDQLALNLTPEIQYFLQKPDGSKVAIKSYLECNRIASYEKEMIANPQLSKKFYMPLQNMTIDFESNKVTKENDDSFKRTLVRIDNSNSQSAPINPDANDGAEGNKISFATLYAMS